MLSGRRRWEDEGRGKGTAACGGRSEAESPKGGGANGVGSGGANWDLTAGRVKKMSQKMPSAAKEPSKETIRKRKTGKK